MASETTTTSLNDLTNAAIAEAYMVLSQGDELAKYITRKPLKKGHSGETFPKYGALTAAGVAEGTELTNTQVSTSGVTITPTEVGLMTTITDMADWESNVLSLGADIGQLAADAIMAKRNQDIWALFDGFTQTAGASNTDITEANIASCIQQLMSAKAPRPYFLAITPHVFEDLLAIYSTNTSFSAEAIRNQVLNEGTMPPIYGVQPLLIDNLASGTSAGKADGADAKCGVFSKKALGIVQGYRIRIELERVAALRGYKVVITSFYAVGEIEDTFGVELLVDNKD